MHLMIFMNNGIIILIDVMNIKVMKVIGESLLINIIKINMVTIDFTFVAMRMISTLKLTNPLLNICGNAINP